MNLQGEGGVGEGDWEGGEGINIQFRATTPFCLSLHVTVFLLNVSEVFVFLFIHSHCHYLSSGQSFLTWLSQGPHN